MKKIILISAFILTMLAGTNFAQTNYPQTRDRQVYQNRQDDDYNRGRHRGWDNRRNNRVSVYVVNEQRYIQVGNRVYREVYRSTYTRNGQLISRQLISRERVRQYDNYNQRDYRNRNNGIRFNVYLRF